MQHSGAERSAPSGRSGGRMGGRPGGGRPGGRPTRGASSRNSENDFSRKKKRCPFTSAGIKDIDYKDVDTLAKFITDRGKILPRRITGVSAHHQKLLSTAIKRARIMALLPFVADV
jgi:small subunit ribosomal protein S18